MISFLFPSILWGLLASLIPLVIHLASKRSSQVVEFSSIIHLKSLETESIKKLKIIEWLLVFIRMLVIVFLILTFAGPIQKSSTTWIASSKESTAVIIIDNSASLDVNKNNKSLLDKNLSLLPDILSSIDGSTSLKIFQTNPPKMIFNDIVEDVKQKSSYITPVPGGVGPMTIACLLKNTLKCFKARQL